MAILGFLIAVLGVVLILIGVIGAAFEVFAKRGKGFATSVPSIAEILKLLPSLIEASLKAPQWLLMIAAGSGLIWFGRELIVGA